jgi:hypothetical protein
MAAHRNHGYADGGTVGRWRLPILIELRRCTRMKRFRLVMLAALVVFVFGAIAATAAQATEGPLYKVEGVRLAEGATKEIIAETAPGSKWHFEGGGIVVNCTKNSVIKGAKIIGEKPKNAATSEETVLFEGCTVEKNGAGCKVEKERVTTEPLTNTLDFQNQTPTAGEKILVLFKGKSSAVLAKIKFEGVCEKFKEQLVVEGSFCGHLDWFNGTKITPLLVGSEPAAQEKLLINVPNPQPSVIWVEKEGTREEVKVSPKAAGKVAALEGEANVLIVGREKLTVITQ